MGDYERGQVTATDTWSMYNSETSASSNYTCSINVADSSTSPTSGTLECGIDFTLGSRGGFNTFKATRIFYEFDFNLMSLQGTTNLWNGGASVPPVTFEISASAAPDSTSLNYDKVKCALVVPSDQSVNAFNSYTMATASVASGGARSYPYAMSWSWTSTDDLLQWENAFHKAKEHRRIMIMLISEQDFLVHSAGDGSVVHSNVDARSYFPVHTVVSGEPILKWNYTLPKIAGFF